LKAELTRLRLAELVLGLVTAPAHAGTIAGDLLEANGSRRLAFLSDLLATTVALALYSISSTPRRSVLLIGLSAALWSAAYVSLRIALAGLGWLSLTGAPGGLRSVALALTIAFSGAVCGCLLAAWNRRREHNPCLPLAAALLAAGACLSLRDLATGSATWQCLLTYLVLVPTIYVAPLLGGALLGQMLGAERAAVTG